MTIRVEQARLRTEGDSWKAWGPYLAERHWGTVRECYSEDGSSWEFFPFEDSHRRAYTRGEDGIAGWSDKDLTLCLSLALWNGKDPVLKERLFGLTNGQGNHGEDVKEIYYYEDATPTHSYLRMSYVYPHEAYPYARLRDEAARRGAEDPEFELLDTGVLERGYFDVQVEYAQRSPGDVVMRITATNCGENAATLHVAPTLLFRHTWRDGSAKPVLKLDGDTVFSEHQTMPSMRFSVEGARYHFTENEDGAKARIGEEVMGGRGPSATSGSKSAGHVCLQLSAGESATVVARLAPDDLWRSGADSSGANSSGADSSGADSSGANSSGANSGADSSGANSGADSSGADSSGANSSGADVSGAEFDALFLRRRAECDAFYAAQSEGLDTEDALILRQALAGMVWTKQHFRYDVDSWLHAEGAPESRLKGRNHRWTHMKAHDIFSMPDAWEYPWFAAWDLALHAVALAPLDMAFAKEQMLLLAGSRYMHPSGAIPAYEWNFDDLNPPVVGWAAWRLFELDRDARGDEGDVDYLRDALAALKPNLEWWLEQRNERGLVAGGFLGLDNIAAFDRSQPPPGGGQLDQADGSAWVASYALHMARMAAELRIHGDATYAVDAAVWLGEFECIGEAMNDSLWHEDDGFYYDRLTRQDGRAELLRTRSLVGLVSLLASVHFSAEALSASPELARYGRSDVFLSLVPAERARRLLQRIQSADELGGPFGLRSLSKAHAQHPTEVAIDGQTYSVSYAPGDSNSSIFGGNSNWRGPVWIPMNYVIVIALERWAGAHAGEFAAAAASLRTRLRRLFRTDERGCRASLDPRLTDDPQLRDRLLFFEFFHADTGRGLGAAHQTGWTSLIAELLPRS